MIRLWVTLAYLLIVLPLAAEKRPWEWTLDERIAKRLDPESIRARAEEKRIQMDGARVWTDRRPAKFTIDGKRNPELLLPFELFNSILVGVDDDPVGREMIQRVYRDAIREFGWDEEHFWTSLQKLTARYRETTEKRLALERESVSSETEALNVAGCRLKAEALQKFRQSLGAEKFDRFLYEKVAPNVGIGSDFPSANEEMRLRYIAGGCR